MKATRYAWPVLLVSMVLITAFPGHTQKKKRSAKAENTTYDQSLYESMQWRLVGPFRGGRSSTATGVRGNPTLFYQGTVGGGVWRTRDGGNTWENISDGYFGGSIGAIAVADSDPNVIYVGEGEQTLRGNVSSGWGVWKSTDAGKTWVHVGLKDSQHISRIRIHPENPDIVYVAAMGNLWKPNEMRGVYRSVDGGANWERVLFVSDKAMASDLVMDPNNPRILYATSWQMQRNGYRMDSGGPDSHLWKSTDGGDNWVKLTDRPGLPDGPWGISGITVSPVNSERVWAIIEAEEGGVYRSDDAGLTWEKTNENRELRQRAWYYSRIYADTQNEDMVYVLNVRYHRSKDGGQTFEMFNAPHGDHHDLWIDPDNNQRMVMADDGGAQVSYDGGANWTTYHNQPTAQFYRVTTDEHFPYRIYGAQQDNTTVRIAHRTSGLAITERDWEPTAGGESGYIAPDPENPDVIYAGTYKGYMMRLDHSTGQLRSTNVWPLNPAGSGVEVMKYRFNWNFPIFFSPHDPNKLYTTSNYVHVTTDEGQSWEVISPDLTRNDPETLRSSGGPITQDNTGVEYYGTIFTAAESHLEPGVIWTGSDDGLVHVTRDGGKNWDNVTPPTSPRLNMMNCIEVHPTKAGHAYVAATAYKFGDYTPYLYKTSDYGQTWEVITSGIDANHYTRAIRADPNREGLLYAGTEWGMYISFDDGQSWNPFQLNLPIVSIRDLHVRDNNLIAATHGRSFWMIDDLTPLHQLNDQMTGASFYLYQPKASYRMAQQGRGRPNPKLEGTNHPDGVMFQYFIKNIEDSTTVALTIMDGSGSEIISYRSDAMDHKTKLHPRSGGNRLVWNMRYPGFEEFDGMVLYSSPNRGPKAVPGTYRVRLTVNGEEMEQEFEILKDPRLQNTQEDYERQFAFLMEVRNKINDAHQTIKEIRAVREDLTYLRRKIGDGAEFQELNDLVDEVDAEMTIIENNIHQTKNQSYQDPLNFGIKMNNHLTFLLADQQRGDFPPTKQAQEVNREVTGKVDAEISSWQKLIDQKLSAVNKMAEEKGIQMMMPPSKEKVAN